MASARSEMDAHHPTLSTRTSTLRNSYKRINPQGAFFFQNFKEQIYCENKFFQLLFTCICFRSYRREFFPKRGCGGIPSPNPLLPPRPSGFRKEWRNCISNFAQNGFALNSEYATSKKVLGSPSSILGTPTKQKISPPAGGLIFLHFLILRYQIPSSHR